MKSSYSFFAIFSRLKLIKRWSLKYCIREENVLEHTGMVAFLSMLLGHLAIRNNKKVSMHSIIVRANSHDISEVILGDPPTPIKYATSSMLNEFRKLEHGVEMGLLKTVPPSIMPLVRKCFTMNTYERDLVKAADVYAAYLKAKFEVDSGNDLEFKEALSDIEERMTLQMKLVPELRNLRELLPFNIVSLISGSTFESLASQSLLAIFGASLANNFGSKINLDKIATMSLINTEFLDSKLKAVLDPVLKDTLDLISSQSEFALELTFVEAAKIMAELTNVKQSRAKSLILNKSPDAAQYDLVDRYQTLFSDICLAIPEFKRLDDWFSPAFSQSIDQMLDHETLRLGQRYANAA